MKLIIITCIFLLIFIGIFILYYLKSQEGFQSTIPHDVWMTWHTKDLPPKMKQNVDELKAQNPELTFHVFDNEDCRKFIKTHFEPDVLQAYDSLIPQSYKSDLWRYCVLYTHGGIYIDIKMKCINGFKLVELCDHSHFTKDLLGNDILTGLIVSEPGNPIFKNCIDAIKKNIQTEYYGPNSLHPTGPGLLGNHVPSTSTIDLRLGDGLLIYRGDQSIMNIYYDGYRDEQKQYQNTEHYGVLWEKRTIYKK